MSLATLWREPPFPIKRADISTSFRSSGASCTVRPNPFDGGGNCFTCQSEQSYFQHIYKELFGCSVVTDMINRRLEYAKYLLQNSSLSIAAISKMCGNENDTHFMRQFKCFVGVTPNQSGRDDKQQQLVPRFKRWGTVAAGPRREYLDSVTSIIRSRSPRRLLHS